MALVPSFVIYKNTENLSFTLGLVYWGNGLPRSDWEQIRFAEEELIGPQMVLLSWDEDGGMLDV